MNKICFADSDPFDDSEYVESNENCNDTQNNDSSKNNTAPPPVNEDKDSLPVYNGVFLVGSSHRKVPYRISLVYKDPNSDKKMFHIAMHACRVACAALDIARGHPILPSTSRMISKECIDKLHNMWVMVGERLQAINNPLLNFEICRLPANPHLVNGVMVKPTQLECVVRMNTGSEQYWTSLTLKYKFGKWICTYADIG